MTGPITTMEVHKWACDVVHGQAPWGSDTSQCISLRYPPLVNYPPGWAAEFLEKDSPLHHAAIRRHLTLRQTSRPPPTKAANWIELRLVAGFDPLGYKEKPSEKDVKN
ncbi:hypothetical protein GWK47_030395 [Chionoecetes opilio]|uniref:Uncharacterized protein n=1 Tax=Chionoecetes opilio TaxID=41210 RepID=A0A8J4YRS6_CHIOP|nr:hypothetical protein GWK47_030395 [Chionoecetes opilio]